MLYSPEFVFHVARARFRLLGRLDRAVGCALESECPVLHVQTRVCGRPGWCSCAHSQQRPVHSQKMVCSWHESCSIWSSEGGLGWSVQSFLYWCVVIVLASLFETECWHRGCSLPDLVRFVSFLLPSRPQHDEIHWTTTTFFLRKHALYLHFVSFWVLFGWQHTLYGRLAVSKEGDMTAKSKSCDAN